MMNDNQLVSLLHSAGQAKLVLRHGEEEILDQGPTFRLPTAPGISNIW